jgi:hypothetical protein
LREDAQAIERQVLYWNPQVRRKREGPKRTWRRTVEEEIGKVGKPKLEPKTGSTGDASWEPCAPEGAKLSQDRRKYVTKEQ